MIYYCEKHVLHTHTHIHSATLQWLINLWHVALIINHNCAPKRSKKKGRKNIHTHTHILFFVKTKWSRCLLEHKTIVSFFHRQSEWNESAKNANQIKLKLLSENGRDLHDKQNSRPIIFLLKRIQTEFSSFFLESHNSI